MSTLEPHYHDRYRSDTPAVERDSTTIPHSYAANLPSYITGVPKATALVNAQPSTWVPADADVPHTLAQMNAMSVASGNDLGETDTWVTTNIGDYVDLGDGSICHWDGTDWVIGAAP